QALAGFMARLPRAPFGTGGPLPAGVAPAPDLAAFAAEVDALAQRDHLPFGTLVAVRYSQPGHGNGVPVGYDGFGDSALWTGSYVASQALRYEATGDLRAVDGAAVALRGLRACLEVTGNPGLLCRAVIPTSSPFASGFGSFVGRSGGVSYAAIAGISRDQYIGTILGIMSAWRRVPALRGEAASLMSMIAGYLQGTGWCALDFPSGRLSAPFTQTPDVLWSVLQGANAADRARFGALHDANQDLARICWLPVWLSSRDLLGAYYPANLFHGTAATLVTVETDPALYREYVKGFEIMREATGHHGNAWFDAAWAMTVPSAAPAAGAQVEVALQRFTLRDRRDVAPATDSDPAIAKVFYTPAAAVTLQGGPPPSGFWVAQFPIPVEKRRGGDFIWQQSPFHLSSGQNDPDVEQPGVDFLLPYWAGEAYGFLP
ncbi:MAG TPA: hypothetical protein VHF22_05060, partial [Planctomycetota bacterium]|nr:hypothetical protein [Planctomycetota bacterium]